ncbi:PREDICTED: U-box domain-containing protein 51-like [Ipomoea nil]|uniref:U-box domain-containing protein 51-like n=1 Tax=Ipomoea nil TaxID=35883 RepID=UPI00090180D7|nr:PREDICTED: U-box domain-containing protein 51-like [Ipomoea nil]
MHSFFLPFRGLCARRGVAAREVILVGVDVATSLSEYICGCSIANIVVGASNRGVLARAFKNADVPTSLGKSVPDFCSVHVVSSKGKVHNIRTATRPPVGGKSGHHSPLSSLPSPDTHFIGDFPSQGTWRSSAGSMESCDGGSQGWVERRGGDPWDGFQGCKNPLPPPSAASTISYSSESIPRSQWESMSSISSASSAKSITDNNTSQMLLRQLGCRNMTSPQATPRGPRPTNNYGNKNPSPAKTSAGSMQQMLHDKHSQLNLHGGYTGDSSFCSEAETELSGPTTLSSNVSFGHYEHSVISDATSGASIISAIGVEEDEEVIRLRQELNRTLAKLNEATKQADFAKQAVRGFERKPEEKHRLEDSKQAPALLTIQREKHIKSKSTFGEEMAQHKAELESQKKKDTEFKRQQEAVDTLEHNKFQYRRYTIEEIEVATNYFADSGKIGEGGYGPVFRAFMDCMDVAIKVLRPDISQGHIQFQQEIGILSSLRHPNMVLLMGACHEYGCLVYEYLDNGSLDDRLFCKNNTPPIPCNIRFKIAAEIATALHFLHKTKPAPIVHRDIKPANILLDRNYVSKIADVGLARLVPPSVADCVTQYQMTAAAGTFCYIDPEYQQTGKLSTKSDVYSLGVLLLQIITARPPIGLAHHVKMAIEEGNFAGILDPAVNDWPVQDALSYANLAVQCCELRGGDRPDLGSVILPELERLRDLKIFQKPYQ